MGNNDILWKLGIRPNLGGYWYISYAVKLVLEDHDYLQHVTKELYPEVGKYYEQSWLSVEHGIRTAITVCWERGNKDLLDELAGYPLKKKPKSSEFIAIIAKYEKDK